MKVKQQLLPRGSWDLHLPLTHSSSTSNSSSCCSHQNGLRPLAPTLATPPPPPPPHEAAVAGGSSNSSSSNTRWNPTEEQIGMLEMLYSKGMRTPNSHQIESIALQLSNFGKIQPKNVFYWFQNHKARERQKLKRLSSTTTTTTSATNSFINFHHHSSKGKPGNEEATTSKKKCTSWTFDKLLEENSSFSEHVYGVKKTLELFPLHPEPTKMATDLLQ